MAKILLVNGSPNEHGCTATALDEMSAVFEKNGIEAERLWLGRKAVPDCIACHKCQQGGGCVFGDHVNAVAERIDEIDGFVFGSPVYYGGVTGRLTSFMDRLFFSIPDDKFAGKPAASVVSCRRGGASAAFERLNNYYLMENMIVAGSQYWNQVHGNTPDEIRRDIEGLQTMRTLAQNMSWLLKNLEAGKASGVCPPEYEEKIFTNFIRNV
ncbi:MAG: flavodoxin family protein [Oscillospiraceae bacterium]|nr:flavodoxin family protein [Oscillospiraceae bacterium]